MILIGSKAIKHHFPDFPREPKDTDYIVKEIPEHREPNTEYLRNSVIESHHLDILDPDTLYTLKMSHVVGWDINWDKHMFDIQFLKKKGCVLNIDLFNELYSYWNTVHKPNKRSDLEMTAEDFFDNALKCEYDHDYIHTLLNSYPTFNKVLKDGAEVDVSEDKFNSLTFNEKCDLVKEEVYVMAWERFSDIDYRHAYSHMLKKFIINHAPLWESIFIAENYVTLHRPNFNYFKTIENELNNRTVKTA